MINILDVFIDSGTDHLNLIKITIKRKFCVIVIT